MQPPDLAIVIPTFCEESNLKELVRRLDTCLAAVAWEAIFVDDDSPDNTAAAVQELSRKDPRIRCLHRIKRRGLSSAVIEGILSTSAPYVAVMDADLQHDETLLPRMLECLQKDNVEVAVASRYTDGGGIGDWNESRARISRFATNLGRSVLKADLTDPMSGFFAIRRATFMALARRLSGIGFKILLDIFASSPAPLRFKEFPYVFRSRHSGASKLDSQAAWGYIMLLLDKLIGRFVPVRFIAFGIVGTLGLLVHMLVLSILFKTVGASFVYSQAAATLVAMTFNYVINNELTYRDMRLRGWAWLRGWASFTLACSVGAVANIGIASYLFKIDTTWILAAVAGVIVGAVWNYAVTMVYTWRKPSAA